MTDDGRRGLCARTDPRADRSLPDPQWIGIDPLPQLDRQRQPVAINSVPVRQ